jgi:hypothetical protein
MQIKIEKPLQLHLDIVETDEHVPSMRIQAEVEVTQFGHKLEYHGSLWFDCSVWDTFVASLNSIDATEANLTDMGGHFILRISTLSEKPEISWEIKKVGVTRASLMATFHSPIDPDTLAHVKHQFTQFEAWW